MIFYDRIKLQFEKQKAARVKTILRLRKKGLTNREIGAELGITGARVQQLVPGGAKYNKH
jgi:DNA-binding CsgD family transcriptional regulator